MRGEAAVGGDEPNAMQREAIMMASEFLKRFADTCRDDAALLDNLPTSVQAHLATQLRFRLWDLTHTVTRCESPIEQLLAIAFESNRMFFGQHFDAQVYPQQEFTFGDKRYRVDFNLTDYECDPPLEVVVECDGHNFHERTKEQAAKDKARDRTLQANGYVVFRFTGSEIVANPDRCALEVFTAIERLKAGRPKVSDADE